MLIFQGVSMLTALQRKGLSKRAQLKVSVVEIYLEPWADPPKKLVAERMRMWMSNVMGEFVGKSLFKMELASSKQEGKKRLFHEFGGEIGIIHTDPMV